MIKCVSYISTIIIRKVLKTYTQPKYLNPNINVIMDNSRLDAGIYSEIVFNLLANIRSYRNGFCSISDFGFKLKRGPNLAKRDLGRSIQINEYKPNYSLLVYPSNISEGGLIFRESYIGARNPIWFLEKGNILFSAEGTVGKTFIICEDRVKITTNFHGMIIYPKKKNVKIKKAIFLGLYLNYLREKGIMSKLSVGGQGGSFAVGYWNSILIPNFPDSIINQLSKIYFNPIDLNPFIYDNSNIEKTGIFNLNNFRRDCSNLISKIIFDLKSDNLKPEDYYAGYFMKSAN